MNKQAVYRAYHMSQAVLAAGMSHALKGKVGCVIVTSSGVCSHGWNGTPTGYDNRCEEERAAGPSDNVVLVTKPEVLHAEENAIGRCAEAGVSVRGASMFVTYAPCVRCARLIWRSGVSHVYYLRPYDGTNVAEKDGTVLLRRCGVTVTRIHEDGTAADEHPAVSDWNRELADA